MKDVTDMTTKPVEQTTGYLVPGRGTGASGVEQQVVVVPTQVRRPWQATIRTVFQALVALATLVPLVLTNVYDSPDAYPAVVVQVLTVAGIVAKVMAMPAVEQFLRDFLPLLAAAPPAKPDTGASDVVYLGAIIVVAAILVILFTTANLIGWLILCVGVALIAVSFIQRRP